MVGGDGTSWPAQAIMAPLSVHRAGGGTTSRRWLESARACSDDRTLLLHATPPDTTSDLHRRDITPHIESRHLRQRHKRTASIVLYQPQPGSMRTPTTMSPSQTIHSAAACVTLDRMPALQLGQRVMVFYAMVWAYFATFYGHNTRRSLLLARQKPLAIQQCNEIT